MDSLLLLILLILPFILFFVLKNYFDRKEIFLQKNVEQLNFEKKLLQTELEKKTEQILILEQELLKFKKEKLETQSQTERMNTENQALRKLVEELQKEKGTKNEDIIVEYILKKEA
ncbi:hypothetical protein [Algoriphagus sp.]|uniref:hypothetical protein n=1 Tax=Algoriphagus sp. TaxID=1872435 RepID=UPI0026286BD4|nr:hypothetical protein [Algoriphagus sp.]